MENVKFTENTYVSYDRWMAHIGLTGTEVLVFAIVYGYFRNGREYYGSLEHTAEMALCCSRTASRALDSLVKKGYLIKRVESCGALKSCFYTVNTDNVKAAVEQYQSKDEHTAKDTMSAAKDTMSPAKDTMSPAKDTMSAAKDTMSTAKDTMSAAKDTMSTAKDTMSTAKDTMSTAKDTMSDNTLDTLRDTLDDNLANNLNNKLTHTPGAGAGSFSSQNGKDEKPEGDDWCPFDETKPLAPDECRRWAVKCWELCCKAWNRLGLAPECRIFLQIFPAQHAAGVIKIFQAFSLKDIKNAMANYLGHRNADESYRPAMAFGGLATFLISGAARYFDDAAIDGQFKIKKGAKNG